MCHEKFFIYPRCSHPASTMGTLYLCSHYVAQTSNPDPHTKSPTRTCINAGCAPFKDYAYIIEDQRTSLYIRNDFQDTFPIVEGGWEAEIKAGVKGYCRGCKEGRSEPLTERQRKEFVEDYLGEWRRFCREREKRRRAIEQQERVLERLRRENGKRADGESEWTDGD
jgi:hypothetical protein